MRLITIGLGACALFALSTVQAQEAAVVPLIPPTAAAAEGELVISAEALKEKVVYPSLSELESRVHIFNAFVAEKKDKAAEKEKEKKVTAMKVKTDGEKKKDKKEAKENKTKAVEAEEKKAVKDKEVAKEKKTKAQKVFKATSAKKKVKDGQEKTKKEAGDHRHKAAQEHGKQQHEQHHADKLDHSHHHHKLNAAAAAKKKHSHAKQHHHHMKAQNNNKHKPTKTKHHHHHHHDDCIVYETITVVPVCKPISDVGADSGSFLNPYGKYPILDGLIPPIESDYPGVGIATNSNESAPGSVVNEDDNRDNDSLALKPELPNIDYGSALDAPVAKAAPIAEPALSSTLTTQPPSSQSNDENAPSTSKVKPEPSTDENEDEDEDENEEEGDEDNTTSDEPNTATVGSPDDDIEVPVIYTPIESPAVRNNNQQPISPSAPETDVASPEDDTDDNDVDQGPESSAVPADTDGNDDYEDEDDSSEQNAVPELAPQQQPVLPAIAPIAAAPVASRPVASTQSPIAPPSSASAAEAPPSSAPTAEAPPSSNAEPETDEVDDDDDEDVASPSAVAVKPDDEEGDIEDEVGAVGGLPEQQNFRFLRRG
ncbi:hypothetical protein KI688_004468 [Linnemannia hyalina]|uniref:Uncharacterized protein n=1 Tax=Linnemannia hyalina TaxID=64524 RepID=A0A9P7XNY3_9FUNG|nr:hypothetical protein KI688_004468 [Linnemannia hyalina]